MTSPPLPVQDGRSAFVVLQENNAIAVLDLAAAEFTGIYPLGTKSWDRAQAQLDASDMDGPQLHSWNLESLFQPDFIDSFEHEGMVCDLLTCLQEHGELVLGALSCMALWAQEWQMWSLSCKLRCLLTLGTCRHNHVPGS